MYCVVAIRYVGLVLFLLLLSILLWRYCRDELRSMVSCEPLEQTKLLIKAHCAYASDLQSESPTL